MTQTLLIRADASPEIGTGHVMRCLALAEPWLQAGSRVVLATAKLPDALAQRVQSCRVELQPITAPPGSLRDAADLARLAQDENAAWTVTDGYHFDAGYHQVLKSAGLRVLCIDDFGHANHRDADFILNQNLGARAALYNDRGANTQLLLGTRYVQLRGEFSKWRGWQRTIPAQARKVLVTLGGTDHENVTLKVIRALQCLQADDWQSIVVIGGSNPNAATLESSVQHPASSIRLLQNAINMPELMAEADLAIAAGGTTAWELAFMGLPALMIVMADNQRSNAEQLDAAGAARNLGWHAALTPEMIAGQIVKRACDSVARNAMAESGRRLVDGLGNYRVWFHLNEDALSLRPANADDARVIWEWANEQAVRAVSFTSEQIPWETHVRWFNSKLSDGNCFLWIANDAGGAAAGMVRFEQRNQEALVSVSLDKSRRGKNLGALLIWTACRKLFRERSISLVNAMIKPDNAPSIRAFEKAGFENAGQITVESHLAALRYQLRRDAIET